MNNTTQDMIEYLRQYNQQLIEDLTKDSRQRRIKSKLREKFKKSQTESFEQLKKQFPLPTDSTNSSLNDMISKLLK